MIISHYDVTFHQYLTEEIPNLLTSTLGANWDIVVE